MPESNVRRLTPTELAETRRTRRRPRRTQFDYVHVRRLVDDLARTLSGLDGSMRNALDIYCGARPYDDLFPHGVRLVGLDVVDNPYGVADVVSDEFLPFDAGSFDLVTCIEAFQYVPDPEAAVSEIRRVLRPGGHAVVSVPFVWEYDRSFLERRYTEPELAHLFEDWEDVRVIENGGRGVAWATLTATLLERARRRLPRPVRPLFACLYVALSVCGGLLDVLDRRESSGVFAMPMNLLLSARRPPDD